NLNCIDHLWMQKSNYLWKNGLAGFCFYGIPKIAPVIFAFAVFVHTKLMISSDKGSLINAHSLANTILCYSSLKLSTGFFQAALMDCVLTVINAILIAVPISC